MEIMGAIGTHFSKIREEMMDRVEEIGKRRQKKILVMLFLVIPVALLHFVTGPGYKGPFPDFVNGYLIDILLPFALYFLLCPQDLTTRFLRPWWAKAIPVFMIGLATEISQYLGVPIFGQTYDPLDILAYAVGVGGAVLVDLFIFSRIFKFWPAVKKN